MASCTLLFPLALLILLPFFPQALGLFSHALRSDSTGFFYTRCSSVTLDPWGASPFLFFPALSPVFSIFSSSISCPRVSSYSFPPPADPRKKERKACRSRKRESKPSEIT